MRQYARALVLVALIATQALPLSALPDDDRLAYALTGGRVIVAPGKVIDSGVVVIRGGIIEAVGPAASTAIPADARTIDVSGKVVHAAFLDPYVSVDRLAGKGPKKPRDDEESESERGPALRNVGPAGHPVGAVRAEQRALDGLIVKDDVADPLRRQGFAVVSAVPTTGVLRGRAAVVSLSDGPVTGRVVDPEGAQVIALLGMHSRGQYPSSTMGAVAVTRQAFLDALWWRDAEAAYAAKPAGQARPPFVAATAALVPAAEGKETVVFDAPDVLGLLRAERVAQDRKLRAVYVGGGDEYRLLKEVAAGKPDLILRVNFPQPDKLERDEEWLDVSTTRLRAYDRAPSNPKWMRDAGLTFSFTTAGLDDVKDFRPRVQEAIARGLSTDDALAAVTTIPARQLGLQDRLGTVEAGKIANLVVETGAPFAEKSRVAEIWIDGKRVEIPEKDKKKDTDSAASFAPAADVRPAPPREAGPVASPNAVVVRGATVWTQGPAGILEDADVLVVGGKVAGVGKNLTAPAGALEIDGKGKHVTPGIIDAHSHTAIDDNTNEGTDNVTAEVRIRDVLGPFEPAIYRELAGGTTVANVLHGSANSIGGQNQIVKLRWGSAPDGLGFVGAPEGIKFALGENPKQSNWDKSEAPAIPQTRMGVADSIRETFQAARDYRRRAGRVRRAAAAKGAHAIPPSRTCSSKRWPRSWKASARSTAIPTARTRSSSCIRTAEEFGFKVAHVPARARGLQGRRRDRQARRRRVGVLGLVGLQVRGHRRDPVQRFLMRERGVVVSTTPTPTSSPGG